MIYIARILKEGFGPQAHKVPLRKPPDFLLKLKPYLIGASIAKAALWAGVLIHQNSISQDGLLGSGQSCIVANQLRGALIRANRFEGDYTGPLVVLSSSINCVLLENRDLRPTDLPESATYFLDVSSSGNLIMGASGTAQDTGTNNKIFLQSPGGK